MTSELDPYDDIIEAEDNYEDRYADEMEMMDDVNNELEEVDFERMLPKKSKSIDLDKELFASTTKLSTEPLSKRGSTEPLQASKRGCSDMESSDDELKYSDDEDNDDVMLTKSSLKPKKLKMSDDIIIPSKVATAKKVLETSSKDFTSITAKKLLEKLKSNPLNTETSYDRIHEQRVFNRPMMGVESINVTSTEGERVYLRLHPSHLDEANVDGGHWKSNATDKGLNLLATPFDTLLRDVQEKRHNKRRYGGDNAANHPAIRHTAASNRSTELWVEKYHPKHYTELLSDDGTNRLLLRWLKLWDEIVFDIKPKKTKQKKQQSNFPGGGDFKQQSKYTGGGSAGGEFKQGGGEKNFQKFHKFNLEDELVLDKKGRPKHKIALLCGNPGLGKTTLAHVISKHAGYNVVEMNASDDRSPELFYNRIESTTQMKAVMGMSKKPNCLIIDEIDGAPSQAIKILLDIIKATETAGIKSNKKKKRKKKELVLNRPIICICNDQYVPALRQLRQVAFTLHFPPTIPSRLASRLLEVSLIEQLRIDMGCLLQLTDKTENDIRSCLNTLQFINEQGDNFKPEDIVKMEVGQKDMKKGFRSILAEVFRLPRSTKKNFGKATEGTGKSSTSQRFYNMLHLLSGNSEIDKVAQGLFDHYLTVKSKEPYMESINLGTDWLQFMDLIQAKVQHDQNYVLYRYTPFLPVAFHMYFAKVLNPKLLYSNVSYENYLKSTHNEQTLQLMQSGMLPTLRRYSSKKVCILDIVPYLFYVTLPSLRPINTQLYSESEKQMLIDLVGVMISYNLTYQQERGPEAQYTYLLEPNIEELTTYTGLPQHRHLPYGTKQLIAREVDMEKMRIAEGVMKPSKHLNPTSSSKKDPITTSKEILEKQKLAPKFLQKCIGGERPQLDFFGRVIKPNSTQGNAAMRKQESKKKPSILYDDVIFKFNEGYTNAVRRTVKVHEFL